MSVKKYLHLGKAAAKLNMHQSSGLFVATGPFIQSLMQLVKIVLFCKRLCLLNAVLLSGFNTWEVQLHTCQGSL